jgi:hypothetical protein
LSACAPNGWGQLTASYPGATIIDGADGTSVVVLPVVRLPPGWSVPTTPVWFVLPVGYPAAQPDCFWADPELRLANGALPDNSGSQVVPIVQVQALWFSWHLTGWRPSHDDVTTYARFISRRFEDAR